MNSTKIIIITLLYVYSSILLDILQYFFEILFRNLNVNVVLKIKIFFQCPINKFTKQDLEKGGKISFVNKTPKIDK